MLRNVGSQKWRVYAWDVTTGLPKTGDAANITARITKDGGSPAGTDDTNPTQVDSTNEPGYYDFDLTQAETNAAKLSLSPKSSTASVVVIACPPVVYTRPQYSSQQQIDSNGKTAATLAAADVTGNLPAAVSDKTGFALTSAYDAAKTASQFNAAADPVSLSTSSGNALVAATATAITADHGSGSYARNTEPLDAAGVRAAVGLANANLDTQLGQKPTAAQILAAGDVDGFTLEQTLKLCLAVLVGKLSGGDTTTITIRAADDSKTRITATVDEDGDGNRLAVILDAAG